MKKNILPSIMLFTGLVVVCFWMGKFLTDSPHPAAFGIGLSAGLLAAVLTFIHPIAGMYILTFSMLLSPELPLAQLSDRAVIVRVDDLLIIMVFFAWAARTAIRKEIEFIRRSSFYVPVFSYFFLILFSSGLGILRGDASPVQSIFYLLKYLEYLIIFILTVNVVDSMEQIDRLMKAVFITAAVVLMYSYFIVLTQGKAPYCPFDIERGVPETATLGGYLVLLMGLAWGVFSCNPRGLWSLWLIAFWIASVPVVFLTRSRASYISFAMVLILTTLFDRRRLAIVFLVVGAVVISRFAFPTVYGTAKARILYTFQPQGGPVHEVGGHSFQLEQSAESRVRFWKRAFNLYLPQHPIIGHGVSPRPALEGQIPVVLYETGLLGVVFFLWIAYGVISRSYKLYKSADNRQVKGLGIGLVLGFSGILIHSLVDTTFIIIRIMEPFWLLMGMVVVSHRISSQSPNKLPFPTNPAYRPDLTKIP